MSSKNLDERESRDHSCVESPRPRGWASSAWNPRVTEDSRLRPCPRGAFPLWADCVGRNSGDRVSAYRRIDPPGPNYRRQPGQRDYGRTGRDVVWDQTRLSRCEDELGGTRAV